MKLQKRILINIIPGLLPIFIFIIADELWGTDMALLIAVVFSVAELFFTWYRTGRFEKFILLDVSLIVALGTLSLWMDNDIFFKLKPALVELILAAIIGLSSFGRKNILLEMSKRYLRDMQITKAAEFKMNSTFKVFFWLIVGHIFLVIWSAFMMSERAWAFISGLLFYLMIAAYFLFGIIKSYIERRKFGHSEILPVVDPEGRVTGKAPREHFHFNSQVKLLHPVVHLHLFDKNGGIFLQHRPLFKKVQPGKWDTAVGGHVGFGEMIGDALKRETFEEIGLTGIEPVFVVRYVWETEVEKELVYMFMIVTDKEPVINNNEVDEGRFFSVAEIEKARNQDLFTPNFLHEFDMLRQHQIIRN